MTTKEITVPSSASEIPMSRYQKYAALSIDEMGDFYTLFSTLTGCSIDEAKRVKAVDVGRSISALVSALNDTEIPLMEFYIHNGDKYGFEPQLDEITFAMLADVATAFEAPETWHKVLAILYRPVTRESSAMGGMYAIEPHQAQSTAYKKRQDVFAEAPASLFVSVRAFFLNGSIALETFILDFLDSLPESLHQKTEQRQQ